MKRRGLILLASATLILVACKGEERHFREPAPSTAASEGVTMSGLHPASPTRSSTQPNLPVNNPYSENAYAVSEGGKLYNAYNCVGCHFHGGGGIGPPLMDAKWIYGSEPQNIYATIVEGRPNGMPAFRGKIPDYQVWEIVAYVRSLSGQLPKDIAPGRDDHMNGPKAPENSPKLQLKSPTGTEKN